MISTVSKKLFWFHTLTHKMLIFFSIIISLLLTIFYLIPNPKPYAGVYTRPGIIIIFIEFWNLYVETYLYIYYVLYIMIHYRNMYYKSIYARFRRFKNIYTHFADKWFYIKATFIYCLIRLRKFSASRKPKGE